jgi:hypothetical protein
MIENEMVIEEYMSYIRTHYSVSPLKLAWISFNYAYMHWGTALYQWVRNLVSIVFGKNINLSGKIINIGAGLHPISGVVNTEFIPTIKNTVLFWLRPRGRYFLNLEFPERYAVNADAVIISHIIEHINPPNVIQALENCFYILASGASLRVSVPDLSKYACSVSVPSTQHLNTRFVAINQLVYRHGHKIMFDFELLSALLAHVGFVDIVSYGFNEGPLGEFDTPASQDESIYMVARKPNA